MAEAMKPALREKALDNEKECVIFWEKKPTVEEKAIADSLNLPPAFCCGGYSDTDEENGNGEDFQLELQKVQEAQGTYAKVYRGRSKLAENLATLKEICLEHEVTPSTAIREDTFI